MVNYQQPGIVYPEPRKTSRLGKASFMIAIGIFSAVILSLFVMMLLTLNDSKGANGFIGISLVGWLLAPAGHLVGLILGIIDVCRKRSKKLVPSLGIAGNAVLGGIGVGLMVLVVNLLFHALGAFR